jgi:MFS family permease
VAAPSDDPGIVRRMQIVDIARSVPLGVLLPLESSLLLTIAIKQFDASGMMKGLVAAAAGVGLLLSPFVTAMARRSAKRVMALAAIMSAISAVGYLLGAVGTLPIFVAGSIIGVASVNAVIPLITVTYERNFPAHERGKRVGWGMTLKVAVSAAVGLAMGAYLTAHPDQWWMLLVAGAGAAATIAWLQHLTPSGPLSQVPGRRNLPWPHFHLLLDDRQLRLTLGAWMLMGFGNLMLIPLRVEYLALPQYGIGADAAKITLLTVTIPSIFRLLTMPLFGRVFDRVSFFAARILVNILFALYVAAFFTGTSDLGLIIGAITLGIAAAGGDLMWSLWVTKFAPPGRVADYMGLHTFSTGIRAVCAPILAFIVIEHISLVTVAWLSAGMMVASSLVLVPEARAERARRAAERRAPAPVSVD